LNGGLDNIKDILPYLIPLLVLEVALLGAAVIDIDRRERVTGGNKLVWVLVVVIFGIIGPIIYFISGRKKKEAGQRKE
jgi:uncharacterized membrane protein YraQ (UPF0718 family)